MSGKLDQSLDEIMKDSKPVGGRRARAGRLPNRKAAAKSKAATTAVIAPANGVAKRGRGAKPAKTTVPVTLPQTGESKISVTGLPTDVDEKLIKDYFSRDAPIKRVIVNYGPDGRSRGSAIVIFNKPTAAQEALKKHDKIPIQGKLMRIEVLLGAKSIPPPPPTKSLSERISGPRNAAKENEKKKGKQEASKAGKAATTNGAVKPAKGKKSGRAGKPKAKTTEELDAEMQDYFGGGDAAAANGSAPAAAATNGDTGMDEVL